MKPFKFVVFATALQDDPHLLAGLNVHRGRITHCGIAEALGYGYREPKESLSTKAV